MEIVKRVTFIAAELATVVLRILRFGAIDACFYIVDGQVILIPCGISMFTGCEKPMSMTLKELVLSSTPIHHHRFGE